MFAGVLDGWKGAHDSLVVCDLIVRVQGDIEVDLSVLAEASGILFSLGVIQAHTLIKTLLPFRSTSVMASLLDKDMMYNVPKSCLACNWNRMKILGIGSDYLRKEKFIAMPVMSIEL